MKKIRRKQMMKKVTAIVLVCLLALTTLTACGGDTNGGSTVNPTPAQNTHSAPAQDDPPPPVQSADNFNTDRVIAVFTREDGSGTRDAFVSITGVGDDMYIEAVVQNGTSQILTGVETNETAIGYVSVGSLSPSVKALEIDGVAPSDATIMDGSYKLQRPFLVVVTDEKKADPLVQDFIDFMLSAEGQEISSSTWTPAVSNPPAYSSSSLNGTLKIGGSTSVDPLMQRMREAYIALNPDVVIEISGGGSGTGISEATSGMLDIGMSSRELRENEKAELTDITIALDGVAVIVNAANPFTGLTLEQVKDIFTGEITRWSQVN
jgi:phosphate transport system substrate-binding protein